MAVAPNPQYPARLIARPRQSCYSSCLRTVALTLALENRVTVVKVAAQRQKFLSTLYFLDCTQLILTRNASSLTGLSPLLRLLARHVTPHRCPGGVAYLLLIAHAPANFHTQISSPRSLHLSILPRLSCQSLHLFQILFHVGRFPVDGCSANLSQSTATSQICLYQTLYGAPPSSRYPGAVISLVLFPSLPFLFGRALILS